MLRHAFAWTLCLAWALGAASSGAAQTPSDVAVGPPAAQAPPAPQVWPPAPYGGATLPPPPQVWPAAPAPYGAPPGVYVSAADYELWTIDRELARLRAERPRMFWPIALTATGGAVMFGGIVGLAASYSGGEQRYRWDDQGNRHAYTYTDPADQAARREFAAITAVGGVILTVGLVLLVPRVHTRRRLREQVVPLQERRKQLLGAARPSLSFDPHGAHASARFAF